jgi:CRISPR-associated protein Csm4
MKLYKTTITPISSFGTPIKGDTLFGQLCWLILYSYGEDRLKKLLKSYREGRPFLIVSDAFAKKYLPKPKMPTKYLKEGDDKKLNRKKVWLNIEDLQEGNFHLAKRDDEVYKKDKKDRVNSVMRNSINYLTSTTDSQGFAPYSVDEYFLTEKDIYFYLDESQFSLKELAEVFELLSQVGYGKDTTIGKGRFKFDNLKEAKFKNVNSKTFMALSPFALSQTQIDTIDKIYYEPFVKFGKFGYQRARGNLFKKPILMMNSGSVIRFKDKYQNRFIGTAIENLSNNYSDVIHQGYTILIPIKDLK